MSNMKTKNQNNQHTQNNRDYGAGSTVFVFLLYVFFGIIPSFSMCFLGFRLKNVNLQCIFKVFGRKVFIFKGIWLKNGRSTRFLPVEPVGGHTEVQKAWQAWTFVDFGQKMSGQDGRPGGGRCDGLRLRGFWRNLGGRFSAREGRWRL